MSVENWNVKIIWFDQTSWYRDRIPTVRERLYMTAKVQCNWSIEAKTLYCTCFRLKTLWHYGKRANFLTFLKSSTSLLIRWLMSTKELVPRLTHISLTTPGLFFVHSSGFESGKGQYLLFNALHHLANSKAIFIRSFWSLWDFSTNKCEECG